MGKYIVGITGASGSIYAKRVIERLIQKGHHVCICMTQAGKLVVESELGWQIGQDTPSGEVEQYLQEIFGSKELIHHYDVHAIGAPIASGSSGMDAMIVVPCSMGTLSAICHDSIGKGRIIWSTSLSQLPRTHSTRSATPPSIAATDWVSYSSGSGFRGPW